MVELTKDLHIIAAKIVNLLTVIECGIMVHRELAIAHNIYVKYCTVTECRAPYRAVQTTDGIKYLQLSLEKLKVLYLGIQSRNTVTLNVVCSPLI